jgi:taurine dioxygenase
MSKESPMSAVTIEPLSDQIPFGSRVTGVTGEALGDPVVRARLADAFEERGVLVFEGVDPDPQMQVAISTVFGPLKDHPSTATPRAGGALGVIEIRHEPNTGGMVRVDGRVLSQWLPWHFDHCYNDQLNRAGVLRAVEVPPDGGMTGFVDGIALYGAVSPEIRDRIEGETVIYAMDVVLENLTYGRPADFEEVEASPQSGNVMAEYEHRPRALHPAVWTRATGEKVLHVSPWMAKGIEGRDQAAADALLHEISEEINDKAKGLSYHHRWHPTDMVIWDNWRVLHSVSGSKPEYGRCMHRTTIAGDYGLGRFEDQ